MFVRILLVFLISFSAFGSDHIDGPVTMKHRVADLTDLYAFPTPNRAGFLTIALDMYPLVHPAGHFDSKVSYKITLRKATIKTNNNKRRFDTSASDELTIRCTFVTPKGHDNHKATCAFSNGLSVTSGFNEITTANASDELHLFAGMRADPFFFNSDWAKAASTKGKIESPSDDDVMKKLNVLSLVLDIDMKKIFPNDSLFAIAAEAYAQDADGSNVRRMDRLGRPEITNVSLVASREVKDLRDLYNLDSPFQVSASSRQLYREVLLKNIAYYDGLDAKRVWSAQDIEFVADIFLDDFLVIDLSKPCSSPGFLEIEKAMLRGKAHDNCGGRKFTDDIMDTLFTFYIAGLDGARVRDGVDQPSAPISSEFPYLAAPDLSLGARAKAFIARKALGI